MKTDRLNIESFTTADGKNFRRPEILKKQGIKDYFSDKGFTVVGLEQIWRHLHGKLEKNNRTFFLKMASTSDIGERTQNETVWNDQIGSIIEKNQIDYFDVPKIYETGTYDGKFYYLSSYHEGSMLASKKPPATGNLSNWLDKIVAANVFFLSLPREKLSFSRDQNTVSKEIRWHRFYNQVQSWYQDTREYKLAEVFDEVKNLRDSFIPGVNHGDFVPWHMIQEEDKFILIDGEHARIHSPRYYDVCYFYHRLYTSGRDPKTAKRYLAQIRKQLPAEERKRFDVSIKPILATRIIGGFWDAKTDGEPEVEFHQNLREDFLKNKLLL
jgi:hypothetical protein